MDTALLFTRLVLAAVFAVAGVAKLADLPGSRRAVAGFGVPQRFADPLGLLLPVAELAAAILLLPVGTAWWGALGGLLLLLAFVAGISVNLARGRTPDCHCFGQLHSEPVGPSTLIRNGVLALLALFVVVQGPNGAGASLGGWLGDRSAAEIFAFVAAAMVIALLAAGGWLLVNLVGQNGRLLLRVEALEARLGLEPPDAATASAGTAGTARTAGAAPSSSPPVGTPAPAFALADLNGATVTLDDLRRERKPLLLVFSDPDCGPCNALLPEIVTWQREHAARLVVTVISRGTPEANKAKAASVGLGRVLLQGDSGVDRAYQVKGTPSAVVVNADGTIGSAVAGGATAIRALATQFTAPRPTVPVAAPAAAGAGRNGGARAGLPIGQAAPSIQLPALGGGEVDLADFRGQPTAVLFWNPGCGFCQRMLEPLKRREAEPPDGAPQLLIVSTSDEAANRAQGFQSPVALDQAFRTGHAFGASGTPSAVLVDAAGAIASPVVAGASAVFELIGLARSDQTVPR